MKNKTVILKDLGNIEFKKAWDYQKELFDNIIDIKNTNKSLPEKNKKPTPDYFLLCEHPHVYTLGKSGATENLLLTNKQLQEKGVSFFRIDRGGDITYHGPGQITGYPLINLENFNIGIKQYIYMMEESIIRTIALFGLKGERLKGATGVWLDAGNPAKARKICAIGVKTSRWVTMHGFTFNVNTDLQYYSYINPCGFVDKGVTSLEKELGMKQDFENVKKIIADQFASVFGFVYP